MFEIIFVIGLITWLVDLLIEYLHELPVFPTLLTALLTIPVLVFIEHNLAPGRQFLGRAGSDRDPVPPEIFRWKLVQPRWKNQIITSALFLPAGWLPIFWFPARLEISAASISGWICGLIAIVSSTVFFSRLMLYFQISQWFDEMTPLIAGKFWLLLYRISDNPDYLPKSPPVKDAELESSGKK